MSFGCLPLFHECPFFCFRFQSRIPHCTECSLPFRIARCSFFCLRYIYLFIFLAVLGLPYCPRAFSSCRDWGLFSEQCAGFSLQWLLLLWHGISCTSKWDLPGPGIEPVSPTLAGEFLSTRPPVKPIIAVLKWFALSLFQAPLGSQLCEGGG